MKRMFAAKQMAPHDTGAINIAPRNRSSYNIRSSCDLPKSEASHLKIGFTCVRDLLALRHYSTRDLSVSGFQRNLPDIIHSPLKT